MEVTGGSIPSKMTTGPPSPALGDVEKNSLKNQTSSTTPS